MILIIFTLSHKLFSDPPHHLFRLFAPALSSVCDSLCELIMLLDISRTYQQMALFKYNQASQ